MGSSGSGKSTLLDLLADRKLIGVASGGIYINHNLRTKAFSRNSAYVLQDDLHIGTLTVEETVRFAAWTRMPDKTTADERELRVQQLLEMVNLISIKDRYVGDGMNKGISGGQIKRLSIAVEIINLPNFIFLDGK